MISFNRNKKRNCLNDNVKNISAESRALNMKRIRFNTPNINVRITCKIPLVKSGKTFVLKFVCLLLFTEFTLNV